MHRSSLVRMRWFIEEYLKKFYLNDNKTKLKVLDIGSYNVNGSYKTLLDEKYFDYTGLDVEVGPDVDIVPANIYDWKELENDSFDIIISGQAFEHIEYPWITIKEISRVLKPNGICCIIAPSSQQEHKYPKDCYRYYADGMIALAKSANLKVLHASAGCVPDKRAKKEWNDEINDTILVAVPENNTIFNEDMLLPDLPVERRSIPYPQMTISKQFFVALALIGDLIKRIF